MNINKIYLVIGAIALSFAMLKALKIKEKEEIQLEENKALNKLSLMKKKKKEKKKLQNKKNKTKILIENMKFMKKKPNFFLGFQVGNNEIHKKVKQLQEKIIKQNPLLHPALVNVSTLHITLAVTHLENEKEIKTLKDKLDVWAREDKNQFFNEPIILSFTGIKSFNNAVAYVDIEKCNNYQKLCSLSQNLNSLLTSASFPTESKAFIPHLTVLKLSKVIDLLKSKKKFTNDFESFKTCTDHFGKQEINHIQLLSMNDPKDEKGYYKCFHQIDISETVTEMDHSQCCVPIPKPSNDES